jgi:hypothetical protein
MRTQTVMIVFAYPDDGEFENAGHIQGFMKRAYIIRGVSEKTDCHGVPMLIQAGQSRSQGDWQTSPDDAVGAKDIEFDVRDVHRPPAAVAITGFLAHDLCEHTPHVGPASQNMAVTAVGCQKIILGTQSVTYPDRDRFLAHRQMRTHPGDFLRQIHLVKVLLEMTDSKHLAQHLDPLFFFYFHGLSFQIISVLNDFLKLIRHGMIDGQMNILDLNHLLRGDNNANVGEVFGLSAALA